MNSMSLLSVLFLATIANGLRISTEKEPEKTLCHKNLVPPQGTNCPKDDWVDAMVIADPDPGKVIVNIGCNKGQDAISWMQRWDAKGFYNVGKFMNDKTLRKMEKHGRFSCPVDRDFQTISSMNRSVSADADAVPIGVCADLMKSNVDLVHGVAQSLGYVGRSAHGTFHIINGAITDQLGETKTVVVQDLGSGNELGHMKHRPKPKRIEVEVMTVDSLATRLELPKVDILMIDTEGFDPKVLKGANSTLDSVRYLEFEVHRDLPNTPWSTTPLKEVMMDLDQKGFECYWAGNNGKLLSMNRCWEDQFEQGAWANAVCVKRGDAWESTLERFALA